MVWFVSCDGRKGYNPSLSPNVYFRDIPLQTGHIMRILSPLYSHRMRITFPVCKRYMLGTRYLCTQHKGNKSVVLLMHGCGIRIILYFSNCCLGNDFYRPGHRMTIQRRQNAHSEPSL